MGRVVAGDFTRLVVIMPRDDVPSLHGHRVEVALAKVAGYDALTNRHRFGGRRE
jgi:hypothetical protein